MYATDADLSGLRVLVVEDTLLVAELITEILVAKGATVIGPVSRVDPALTKARGELLDGALLDVNLAGEPSFAIAEALKMRGIPFIFLTGYTDPSQMPPALRGAPRVTKPFREGDLAGACAAQFRVAN